MSSLTIAKLHIINDFSNTSDSSFHQRYRQIHDQAKTGISRDIICHMEKRRDISVRYITNGKIRPYEPDFFTKDNPLTVTD
jgi:hypothetical protein